MLQCNCSEPSIFLQLIAMNACIRERLTVKIYLADTPHRENESFRGEALNSFIEGDYYEN